MLLSHGKNLPSWSLDEIISQIDIFSVDPIKTFQNFLILNNSTGLLDYGFALAKDTEYFDVLNQFLSHLLIFFNFSGINVNNGDEILTAFIRRLMEREDTDFVSFYCRFLGLDVQAKVYAEFLHSLEQHEDRLANVIRAKNSKLVLEDIAFHLLQLYRRGIEFPSTVRKEHSHFVIEKDMELIKSIEWFNLIGLEKGFLLEWVNILLRYFLANRKIDASIKVINESCDFEESDDPDTKEYFCYQDLLVIIEKKSKWDEIYDKRNDSMSWISIFKTSTDEIEHLCRHILTSNWLNFEEVKAHRIQPDPTIQNKEFSFLRQIYIPEIVMILHSVLFRSEEFIKE